MDRKGFLGFNIFLLILVAIVVIGFLNTVPTGIDLKSSINDTPLKPATPAIDYLGDKATYPVEAPLWIILFGVIVFTWFMNSKNK